MFGKKLRNPNVFPFGECQKNSPLQELSKFVAPFLRRRILLAPPVISRPQPINNETSLIQARIWEMFPYCSRSHLWSGDDPGWFFFLGGQVLFFISGQGGTRFFDRPSRGLGYLFTHSVGGGFFSKNCLKTHLHVERSERGNIIFFASGRGGALRFPPPFDVDVSPSEVNSGHFTCVVLYMRLIFSYYSPFIFKPTVTSLNSYTVYHHECTGNVLS